MREQWIVNTERLCLRPLLIKDANHIFLLNSDKDVIKYTGDVAFKSVNEARIFLRKYKQFALYKMGRFGVFLSDKKTFIGWCGLKYKSNTKEIDIGYRFLKKYWGNGYATEAAKACLDYGFDQLQLANVIGNVWPENLASINVLEKIGMKFKEKTTWKKQEWWIFEIQKNAI